MAGINYAEQYSRELANAYPYALNFGALYATPNNGRYRMGEDGKTAGFVDCVAGPFCHSKTAAVLLRNLRKSGFNRVDLRFPLFPLMDIFLADAFLSADVNDMDNGTGGMDFFAGHHMES